MTNYKEQRILREMMGLCTSCGKMRDDPRWKTCDRCRAREREKKIANMYSDFEVIPLPDKREVPSNHKCWKCEWSTFLGDRFFCPFAEGTCAKSGTVLKGVSK